MKRIKELREQRGKLLEESRKLLDKAGAEKRSLLTDEQDKYDKIYTDVEELDKTIEREEKQALSEARSALNASEPPKSEAPAAEKRATPRSTQEYRDAFNKYLLPGSMANLNSNEYRALSAGVDTAAGYLVAPEQFVNSLIKNVDDSVFIRQLATKETLSGAATLGIPSLETDAADADWTSEILVGSEETTMAVGKRTFATHPLGKYCKISNTLLRKTGRGAEALVMERLAYKFGITLEKAYMTGTGAQQPLGVFTASSTGGISTSRDISTDNTTTTITADGLMNAAFTLKQNYWKSARWIFSRSAIKMIRKLKSGDGEYLFRVGATGGGLEGGNPDTILGFPYLISEYCPSTFTTGLYVGILGDFSKYWIVDGMDLNIRVADQIYIATDQTGYFARLETDGMPVLEEAFVRVKLA